MKPSLLQKIRGWFLDYCFLVYWMVRGLFSRSTPEQLLHPPSGSGVPILLIPGVYENWRFMQPIAAHLYRAGHPVHVLDKLGYNTGAVDAMARIVSDYLDGMKLQDVVVIAHSKGGLIAKQALANPDTVQRVRHVIAINTPFSGSRYASLFLMPSVRMFTPTGLMITHLALNRTINSHISSLYSVFDPHIPETSHLEGGENIVLPAIGHFRPLGDPRTVETVDRILTRSAIDGVTERRVVPPGTDEAEGSTMTAGQNPAVGEPGTSLHDLAQGTTIEVALSFYDALPAVTVDELIGAWKGAVIPTGNPLDELMEAFGWHGKQFDDADVGHPLIFDTPSGGLVHVNPALVPLGLTLRFPMAIRRPVAARVFRLILPILGTRRPKARLRMMEYRGVVTGTMTYDDLPIHDAFRKVDDDTMLGAMDLRGLHQPFMFILRRENAAQGVR